jgi:undecaprenyl-diphosphatase
LPDFNALDLNAIDLALLHWVNAGAHRSVAVDKVIVVLGDATFLQGGFLFAYLWGLWFTTRGEQRSNRLEVLRICAGISVALAIARAMQILLPGRSRPLHDPSAGFVLPYGEGTGILEHWNSFPSDHAVIFFAIAAAIWMRSRLWGGLACLWVFIFGCLPRIYLGYHYPSDIVAGAVIGAAIMGLAYAAPLTSAGRRAAGLISRWEQQRPAVFYTLAFAVTYQFVTLFDTVRMTGRAAGEVLVGVLHLLADGGSAELSLPVVAVMAMALAGLAVALWRRLGRRPARRPQSSPR